MFGLLIACALTKQKSAWEASYRLQPAIPVAACAVEEHRRAMGYPRLYQWFRNTIIRTEQTPECRFEAGVEWQILWLCNRCLVCGRKKNWRTWSSAQADYQLRQSRLKRQREKQAEGSYSERTPQLPALRHFFRTFSSPYFFLCQHKGAFSFCHILEELASYSL